MSVEIVLLVMLAISIFTIKMMRGVSRCGSEAVNVQKNLSLKIDLSDASNSLVSSETLCPDQNRVAV